MVTLLTLPLGYFGSRRLGAFQKVSRKVRTDRRLPYSPIPPSSRAAAAIDDPLGLNILTFTTQVILREKDARMDVVAEILLGVRIIKWYPTPPSLPVPAS